MKRDPLANRNLIQDQEPIEILGFKTDPRLDAADNNDQREPFSNRTPPSKREPDSDSHSDHDPFARREPPRGRDAPSKEDPHDRDPPPQLTSKLDPTRTSNLGSKLDPTDIKNASAQLDPTRTKSTPDVDPTRFSNVASKLDPTGHSNPTISFDPTKKLDSQPDSQSGNSSAGNSSSSLDPSHVTQTSSNSTRTPQPTAAFDPTRKVDPSEVNPMGTATSTSKSGSMRPQTFTANQSENREQRQSMSSSQHGSQYANQGSQQNWNATTTSNFNQKTTESKGQQVRPKTDEVRKIIVFGGNGFVGSHICQKLVESNKFEVVSINRSGRPKKKQEWVDKVEWVAADAFNPQTWAPHLTDAYAVVSCLGAFSTNRKDLERLNGDTTLVPANLSMTSEEGSNVKKFIFVSATEGTEAFTKMIPFLSGYLEGKRKVEQFLLHQWAPKKQSSSSDDAVLILRPGFIYGPRTIQVANQPVQLPLHWLGRPLELLMKPLWSRLAQSSNPSSSTSEFPASSQASEKNSASKHNNAQSSKDVSWTQMLKMMSEPPISVETVAATVVEAVSPDPIPGLHLGGIVDVKTMNENFARIQQNKEQDKKQHSQQHQPQTRFQQQKLE